MKQPRNSLLAVLLLLSFALPIFFAWAYAMNLRDVSVVPETPAASNAPSAFPGIYGYVANMGEDSVSVIDLAGNAEIGRVPVGDGPYEVALTFDEQLVLVTNSYTDTVSIIDTSSNSELQRIKVGNLPRGLAVSADGMAYVANTGDASLSVIDVAARLVVTTVTSFPSNVWDVAVSPNGAYAYLTNEGGSGDVYQVDTQTWNVTSLISAVPGCGAGLDISTDGTTLYVADPCRTVLRVVDIAARTWEERPLPEGQGAWNPAFSPRGDLALVTNGFLPPPGSGRDTTSIIETGGHAELKAVSVGPEPIDAAILGGGRWAYVTIWDGAQVAVVDLELGEMADTIGVGSRPWGIALMGQNLGVSKDDWQDPRPAGWANHYVIRVRNNTSRILHSVVLWDDLPSGAQFMSTMETGGSYNPSARRVTWELGDLAPAEERELLLRFLSASNLGPGTVLRNQAFATCAEGMQGYDLEDTTLSQPPVATSTWTLMPTPTATPTSVTRTPKPTSSPSPTPTWTPLPTGTSTGTASATPTATETTAPMVGSLRVLAWLDLDGDGSWDENEPPLMGAVVVISGEMLVETHIETTDDGGQTEIGGLIPGDYLVRVEDIPGRTRTTSRTVKLAIQPSETSQVLFGFRVPPLYLPIIETSME